eukprot:g33131.t1
MMENLDKYTTTVMDHMSKCVEDCLPKKSMRVFPNRKPWMNWEIHSLLKSRHAAFKLDDPDLHRKSRHNLCKAIRDAKRQCQIKLEAQTNNIASSHLWQGLNNITGHKMKQSEKVGKDTFLPHALNTFKAQLEQDASVVVSSAPTTQNTPVLSVTAADIRSTFLRVNPRKAMGPDGIPSHALRSSVDQLVEIFINIFNISRLQAEVPTCFKKTTIIPVAKKTSDAISLALHSSLEVPDNKDTYIRLMFIDYSSTFNIIIPSKFISKLRDLGLSSTTCNWILSFPIHRPQSVRL